MDKSLGSGRARRASVSTAEAHVFAEDIVVSYKRLLRRHTALRSAGVCVRSAQVVAVVGPNGAGKTTLFRTLLGFIRPDSGLCRVGGLAPAEYRRRHGVGYVPEQIVFPRAWTVRDLLARSVDLSVRPGARGDDYARAVETTRFDDDTLRKEAAKCSNGTQRRLWLACTLAGNPAVLVLDEPFAGLDPPARRALRREVRAARDRGTAVLVASHELAEVERVADTVVLLRDGATSPPRDLGRSHRDAEASLAARLEAELFGEDK